ncbi:MAG: hypothetical protein AAF502_21835 [Bacteroidota bacterium]
MSWPFGVAFFTDSNTIVVDQDVFWGFDYRLVYVFERIVQTESDPVFTESTD